MLKLPEALCVERAMRRVNHEGGVEGASAPAIVRRMYANIVRAGLPSASESISSVSVRKSLDPCCRLETALLACWVLEIYGSPKLVC